MKKYPLKDFKDNEFYIFTGKAPRQAALKAFKQSHDAGPDLEDA
jgi:hypothetical protein